MKVAELKDKAELKPLNDVFDKPITGVFISDMVSDVMAGAAAGALWVTTQTHKNVVAAANLVDISAVIDAWSSLAYPYGIAASCP